MTAPSPLPQVSLKSARHLTAWLSLLIVVLAAWHLVQGWSPLRINVDAVHLLDVAASVADGNGYVYNGSPTYYPHGYPTLIAALDRVGLGVSWVLVGVNLAFMGLGVRAVYLVAREQYCLPRWVGLLLVTLSLLNFVFIKHIPLPTSDVTFFGIATASAYFLSHAALYPDARRWLPFLAGAALAGIAFWFRTIGIALAPAVLWAALSNGSPLTGPITRFTRRRSGAVALVLIVLAGAAGGAVFIAETQAKYLNELTGYLASMTPTEWAETIYERARISGALTLNVPASQLPPALGVVLALGGTVVSVVVGYGLWLRRRRLFAVDVYTLVYILIILIWPAGDARFLMPIFPLLMLWAVTAVRHFMRPGRRAPRARMLALSAYLVLYSLAGAAALTYSTSLTFAGDEFPARYGGGSFETEYRLALEGPRPGRTTDYGSALDVLARYEPRAKAHFRAHPGGPSPPPNVGTD